MINYILMLLSITLETSKNAFSNHFSKNILKSNVDVYKFNTILYIGSFIMLLLFGKWSFSPFTLLMSIIFSIVTAGSQHFVMKAYENGPMSFTTFIQGCNLVIPVAYGMMFLGERLTCISGLALLSLLISMGLVLDLKVEHINKKWLLFAFASMIFTGGVGVLQTIHQNSSFKEELIPFLRFAFLFAIIINGMMYLNCTKKEKSCFNINSIFSFVAFASGVFMGAVNIINLYLAGIIDKIILFPFLNGGLIFLTVGVGIVFFHEKTSIKQRIGLVIGIIAICVIG